jgi:hypothetical protein
MRLSPALWALLLAGGLTTGCVERRYVMVSDPPGALVYRDGRPIGNTPVDDYFVYYGKYHFTLIKDGYETLQVEENFSPPWYEYPLVDFFAENLWPFKIRDVRRPAYQMQPMQQARPDVVLDRANELRARNKTLVPFNPASVPGTQQARPAQVATPAPSVPAAPGNGVPVPAAPAQPASTPRPVATANPQ